MPTYGLVLKHQANNYNLILYVVDCCHYQGCCTPVALGQFLYFFGLKQSFSVTKLPKISRSCLWGYTGYNKSTSLPDSIKSFTDIVLVSIKY